MEEWTITILAFVKRWLGWVVRSVCIHVIIQHIMKILDFSLIQHIRAYIVMHLLGYVH